MVSSLKSGPCFRPQKGTATLFKKDPEKDPNLESYTRAPRELMAQAKRFKLKRLASA